MVDWDGPRVLLVAVAVATLVGLVVAASTSAVAFGTYNPAWDGASDLREVARDEGSDATVAHESSAYDELDPNGSVAVVLAPSEGYTATEAATLGRFVERGGTLVVADDFGPHANPLLAELGARSRIDGVTLRDEREFYRSPAMPVATNVSAHRLTAGVESVTVNHGSAVQPNGATVLVATTEYAYADTNGNGALDDDETLASYPVVTSEPVGEGTVVVAGDPSVFINVMLERPGNERFVRGLFASHETVLLDYSHAGGLPPLSYALLVLRGSPGLQLAVGLAGLGLVGWWSRGLPGLPTLGRARGTDEPPRLTEAAVLAYLDRHHPEWDDDRVERVVGGIIHPRPKAREDE